MLFGVTRWNPFEELNSLHREMDRVFGRVWGDLPSDSIATFRPAMEVQPDKEAWHVRIALPGIDPKDVHVDVTGSQLTVRGERKEERREEGAPYVSEFAYGRFERTLSLPETIDSGKVNAAYRNGVLELSLPLKEGAKPRRIQITTDDPKKLAA